MTWKQWMATGAFAIAAMAACSSDGNAQDKKAHDTAALNSALKDVINAGAKMFNDQGDHAGCYRLYQGSLMSVRPFVPPEMQKSIEIGFANAEKLASYGDRAFELRRVLDDIRTKTKPAGIETKIAETKGSETKGKETKGSELKGSETKSDKGTVAGRITYQGKPVAGGFFVTLLSADGKKFSSAVQKDGSFQFMTPIALGDFRVLIEAIPGEAAKLKLPTRYTSESTSGLTIHVQAGKQHIELSLVN